MDIIDYIYLFALVEMKYPNNCDFDIKIESTNKLHTRKYVIYEFKQRYDF